MGGRAASKPAPRPSLRNVNKVIIYNNVMADRLWSSEPNQIYVIFSNKRNLA